MVIFATNSTKSYYDITNSITINTWAVLVVGWLLTQPGL